MAGVMFGAFIPQGWKLELASVGSIEQQWSTTIDVAVRAEALGYDSVWVYDHFHNVPRPAHETVFECWTTIAAISQLTSRVQLGQMVGCNGYRPPSLLAKITSTIDVISGGRLIWGIGAGWYENEFRGYGYEFPSPKDRIAMLRESVEIVKSMWTQPDTTYRGEHYSLVRANCDPKPLQQPHPPILIGGGGEQLTLRVVARHADLSNFGGSPHEWSRKLSILREHCAAVGRDPDEIGNTWSPEVLVRATEAELQEAIARAPSAGPDREAWRAANLVGTPEQVCEKMQAYLDLGCSGFIPWNADYPSVETLDLFARDVIPNFR
jgi:F420-dependent oxidoreductase-like protein